MNFKGSSDIILNNFLKIKLNNILKSKQLPNLIIIGEPSTGKTSTILCLAKIIYKDDYENNVLELNASDDRGLTMISSTIQPFCKKKSNYNKLVILDEADSITQKAQNLLNNIIAEYRKNTRFIFICNQNAKISESIQSRCMILKFPKVKKKHIKEKIIEICQNENTEYTDDGVNRLLFFSDYDIRQCINNLECIIYTKNSVTTKTIDNLINVPKIEYIKKIIELCKEKKLDESLLVITKLFNNGYSSNDILLIFIINSLHIHVFVCICVCVYLNRDSPSLKAARRFFHLGMNCRRHLLAMYTMSVENFVSNTDNEK